MNLSQLLTDINNFVLGKVMIGLLLGTGIFLTFRLKFLPWRNLVYALKLITQKKTDNKGDLSPFQSLMTALSSTIGTGNIVGVATAMVLGGPGAVIWMWISAAFGLSTKYAESVLAVRYRETNSVGEMAGGPMYSMKNGIGGTFGKIMAVAFSIFTIGASLGIGNSVQANSISTAIKSSFGFDTSITGAVLFVISLSILMRGIHSIGVVSSVFVPFMAFFYLLFTATIIIFNIENIPSGFATMLKMAFSTDAMAGGVGGSIVATMFSAMHWGIARGVFSNEAGLGSAPIVAAAARTDHASRQGYVNMTGTFFDTMVICMLTALVISSSGVLGIVDNNGELVSGADLTIAAFATLYGEGANYIVAVALTLFAYSAILGWEYYGEKCLEYLVDNRAVIYGYRFIFSCITYIGATQTLDVVWNFSDTMNGLMAIPNLICLLILNKKIAEECFHYQKEFIEKGK